MVDDEVFVKLTLKVLSKTVNAWHVNKNWVHVQCMSTHPRQERIHSIPDNVACVNTGINTCYM